MFLGRWSRQNISKILKFYKCITLDENMCIILSYVEVGNHNIILLSDQIGGVGDISCKMLELYLMDVY